MSLAARRFYVYPEWFRDARVVAGYSVGRCAVELGVTSRTVWNWEAAQTRVPCSAYRLLRVLGCYALPGRPWEGWLLKGDTLWSPESKPFRAVDFAWWGLTVAMARAFRQMHAEPALNATKLGQVLDLSACTFADQRPTPSRGQGARGGVIGGSPALLSSQVASGDRRHDFDALTAPSGSAAQRPASPRAA